MPIYQFQCEKCGTCREEIQKFEDPPPAQDCAEGGECAFVRKIGTCTWRFRAGVGEAGGWVNQANGLSVRTIKGTNSVKYGEGSV